MSAITNSLRAAAEVARTQIHDGALATFLEDQARKGDATGFVRESAIRVAEALNQNTIPECRGGCCDSACRAAKAEALREAADEWTQGAWADTPRRADRVADRIAAAQYAGDWLRARAAALAEDPS